MSTSPAPLASIRSITFGFPSEVTWRPPAPGSTPEKNDLMIICNFLRFLHWQQLNVNQTLVGFCIPQNTERKTYNLYLA